MSAHSTVCLGVVEETWLDQHHCSPLYYFHTQSTQQDMSELSLSETLQQASKSSTASADTPPSHSLAKVSRILISYSKLQKHVVGSALRPIVTSQFHSEGGSLEIRLCGSYLLCLLSSLH